MIFDFKLMNKPVTFNVTAVNFGLLPGSGKSMICLITRLRLFLTLHFKNIFTYGGK